MAIRLPVRLMTAPERGTAAYINRGRDDMISLIEGTYSTIFIDVNEYVTNNKRVLITPPADPINMPSINKGSLINLLGAPSNFSVSISSFLL
jgi:hypothetical protein